MKKIYIPIMTPTILAAAVLGGGPGVAQAQAAEAPQQIEHIDVSWSTDLGGGTVEQVDVDGITKYFVLPDGGVSLFINSRLRVVTTTNGVVVQERVWQEIEQIKVDFGQDFLWRTIDRARSSSGSQCLTNVVFKVVDPDTVVVDHTNSPGC